LEKIATNLLKNRNDFARRFGKNYSDEDIAECFFTTQMLSLRRHFNIQNAKMLRHESFSFDKEMCSVFIA